MRVRATAFQHKQVLVRCITATWILHGALGTLSATDIRGATSLYLKVVGTEGESNDDGHVGWIDIDSYSISLSGTSPADSGALSPLIVTAPASSASPSCFGSAERMQTSFEFSLVGIGLKAVFL